MSLSMTADEIRLALMALESMAGDPSHPSYRPNYAADRNWAVLHAKLSTLLQMAENGDGALMDFKP